MKYLRIIFILLIFCLSLTIPVSALVIKLGSLAPEGSPWDKALKYIASEWKTISGGRISMKIYPGGIAGDEPDMVRKIRINQLQAAALTGIGLANISEDILAIQLPLLVRTDEELYYVLERMRPTFDSLLEEKGFKILGWIFAGWAHFFAKKPVVTPDDLMRQKMQVDDASPKMALAWKKMGFHVVPIPSTQTLSALQSGMVEAFMLTPLTAAAVQWFGLAKNMSSLKMSPMIGGLIISNRIWKRIPKDLKPKLITAVNKQLDILHKKTEGIERQALEIMLENELKINHVPPEVEAQWKDVIYSGFDLVIGNIISKEVFDEVNKHLKDFRNK